MDDLLELRTASGAVTSVRSWWTQVEVHTSSWGFSGVPDVDRPGFNLDSTAIGQRAGFGNEVSRTTTYWLKLSVTMDDGGEVPIVVHNPSVTATIGQRVRLAHGRATTDWRWSLVAFQNFDTRQTQWFEDAVLDVAFDATRGISPMALSTFRRLGGPWNNVTFAACGFLATAFATAMITAFLQLPLFTTPVIFVVGLLPVAAVNARVLKALKTEMSRVCDKTLLALEDHR